MTSEAQKNPSKFRWLVFFKSMTIYSWWFFPNPFEKCARLSNWDHFPRDRGDNDPNLWNQYLDDHLWHTYFFVLLRSVRYLDLKPSVAFQQFTKQRSPKAQQVGKKSMKTHPFLKSTAAKCNSKSLPKWFLTGTSTGPQSLPKNMLKTGGSMDVDQKTPHASFAKAVKIQSSDGSIPIRLLCRIHWSPGKRATHCQPRCMGQMNIIMCRSKRRHWKAWPYDCKFDPSRRKHSYEIWIHPTGSIYQNRYTKNHQVRWHVCTT